MISKKKKDTFQININDSFPFLDGLDLSVNMSIIIYLCSFFLPDVDTRIAIVIMSSIIFLSFTSRVFDLKILKLIQNSTLEKINIFIILPFLYLPPTLITLNSSTILAIIILSTSRIFIGLFFSFCYRNLKVNDLNQFTNLYLTKYWVIYFLGLFVGFFLFSLMNEVYSNDFLNSGGWKILYIILISISLFLYVISYFILKISTKFDSHIIIENSTKNKFSINFLIILIPIFTYLLFSSSHWLPKFSNPENLHFLSYDFLYPFLTIMLFIFLTPLANLVGRKKSITFFCLSITIISAVISFISHSSSYSIDFLKFFIALVSSFTICCFILQSQYKKKSSLKLLSEFNLVLFILSITVPFIFYYFIYHSINYSGIYIFFALVYLINYFTFFSRKDG